MSQELQVDFLSGKNVYFLVRNTTGSIWNGASFVAYNTANYTDYDIAATEQGTASGYYTANMPAVAAGQYNIVAKERVGGAPAESDLSVGWGILQWDGSAVLPLSSVPTSTTATANILPALFRRDMDLDEGSAAVHSLCSAILKMVSGFELDGANAFTYRTDGTTVHMTQARTTDAALVATKELGVAT